MLAVQHITYSYGRRLAPVFQDFSLTFKQGHIYGLLGKNGTGKSTLLYIMSGLLRTQKGHVAFEGMNVLERQPEMLREMFLVPEEFSLPPISLRQYVQLHAPFYPHFNEEILYKCLMDFELNQDMHLGALSMGQKKKIFMSIALATGAKLLLMDEPTNGLDIPSKSLFRKVISQYLREDQTLIISTHQVNDVAMLLDHVVMLEGSQLLLNRSTAEICATLCFEERSSQQPTYDALYVQPSIHGNSVITLNTDPDVETPINLELLFNCAQKGKLPETLTR